MLRNCGLAVALFALAALPMRSRGDQITLEADGVGAWQTLSSPLNPGPAGGGTVTGTPFWNNGSWDATAANVGYFLTGTGNFAGNANSPNIPIANLQYWGTAAGLTDPTEKFSSGGSAVSTQLLIQVAGNAGVNQLWYQDTTGMHELYDPSTDHVGQSVTFSPVGDFTFLLINPTDHYTFDSDSNSGNQSGDANGNQHFVAFQSSTGGPLYIGVEDLPFAHTDADYNDMIFSLQAVPEPASVTLLALGTVGLIGGSLRRRRNRLAAQ